MNDFWFRLPPGYVDLDLDLGADLDTDLDLDLDLGADLGTDVRARTHTGTGTGTGTEADEATPVPGTGEARILLSLLGSLAGHDVMHAAVGLHDSGDSGAGEGGGGICVSVVCLSDLDTGSPHANVAAARCALGMATDAMGAVRTRELVTLACGRPAALATYVLPAPPEDLLRAAGLPTAGRDVFQARLAIARPHGSHVIVIDLTTTELALADAYTDILLGIGQTVAFEDPTARSSAPPRPSRLLEVLL